MTVSSIVDFGLALAGRRASACVELLQKPRGRCLALVVCLGLGGCSEAAANLSEAEDTPPADRNPPLSSAGLGGESGAAPPSDSSGYCAISADCGPGAHCHLGRCVAACDSVRACSRGLSCSPRGRCLEPGALDSDPLPSASKVGDVTVEPRDVLLTEGDDRLTSGCPRIVASLFPIACKPAVPT